MPGLKTIGKLGTIASNVPNKVPEPPPPTKAAGRPPPILDDPVIYARGQEFLGLGIKRTRKGVPPKPLDFEGSIPEWVWYYVSARKLPPHAVVGPPYVGAPDGLWQFQVPELEGEARQVGNSISDFVYNLAYGVIIVRIEGFYWHTNAPPADQARDQYLTTHAQNAGTRVERVEDHEYMDDVTGGKAGALLAEILAGGSRIGAVHGGTAQAPRYAEFI
jgi:hypothetical protein